MKTAHYLGKRCSAFGFAAVVALGLTLLLAPRAARAQTCAGDCDGSGDVTVNEIIVLVNIDLGTAAASACPSGIPAGRDVDITLIIQAVGYALTACPAIGPTPTPTPGTGACGDGVITAPETCDDGGTCTGGTNAGTHCTAESDCTGNGICDGGTKDFFGCTDNNGCPGGKCIHCKTFGGDGCAANCTAETNITMTLKPGVVQGLSIKAGTSGAVVHSDILTIPLPLTGTQVVTIGQKGADGIVPAVVSAASIQFPRIPVSSIACACLRGVAAKTCGGTLYDIDGLTLSTDCTPGYVEGTCTGTQNSCNIDSECQSPQTCDVHACDGKNPCSFLHGPGNGASGALGCGASGYSPVDVLYDLDSGGESGIPGSPIITLSGSGPIGSGLLLSNSAIGTVAGSCSGTDTGKYGPDGQLCTEDDPQSSRGTQAPQMQVTGTATGKIENANATDGDDLGGPFSVDGNPLDCDALLNNHSVTGAGLASSFVSLNQPTTGDIIVTNDLVGQ